MFMVQNNQTIEYGIGLALRSHMTLTGLKDQNEPNKVAAQQHVKFI